MNNDLHIGLPQWLGEYTGEYGRCFPEDEDRISLVIELAARNVEEDLGGPFGAAIFQSGTGRLISAGVNRVMDQNCSVLHAEVMAIMLAQRRLGTFTLARGSSEPPFELACSCEPCAMCIGAITWSGIQRLVCAAREVDAFAVGFDEGFKPHDWIGQYRSRGIAVRRDVMREEACAVFQRYVQLGGVIYNPS